MRMGRTSAWRSAAAAALLAGALACAEQITTPGTCPDYCPADTLSLVDTVLTGIVVADTSIRGFNTESELGFVLAGDQDSLRTLSYLWFQALPQRWFPISSDTVGVPIAAVPDSIRLTFQITARDTAVGDLRILVYRAPVTLDTSTLEFDTLAQYAVDSLLLDSLIVDSLLGDSASGAISHLVPVALFTPDSADSNRIALVLDVRSAGRTTVALASTQTGQGPRLTYHVRGAPPQDTLTTSIQLVPDYDTYARTPELAVGTATGIRVGEVPSARALLFFQLPAYIVDSVTIIRAQLELRLSQPAAGRPREEFLVRAVPVLRYFGGKSVVVPDTSAYGSGLVTAGDTGTVRIEVARPLRLWRGIPTDSLPRVLQLRNRFEGLSLGGFEALGSGAGASAPRIRITYVRPFRFGVP